jgi:hypothetical protein
MENGGGMETWGGSGNGGTNRGTSGGGGDGGFVDDFIPLAIARSKEQLDHVARGMMEAIHDVFPPAEKDEEDPIALKKLKKGDGTWMLEKDILGFMFNGDEKTLWLEEDKRLALLSILKGWLRTAERSPKGIPFEEFQSVLSKIRHAFIAIPAGKGLLSPCNGVLRSEPQFVYLQRNQQLKSTLQSIRTLLRESATNPTKCKQLVRGHPHFVGVKDSSGHGVGGVVVGETDSCKPTVFRVEWPQEIRDRLVSWTNPNGSITNSDLEMAGLLLLWLVMEEVCPDLACKHAALFSDNQPTVCWVERMASKHSIIAGRLLQILALRLHKTKASPITPQHIKGAHNAMTDIPSRSFGSEPQWHFKTDNDLLTFFNNRFPLPNQNSWSVFQLNSKIVTRVISVLLMKPFTLEDWRRLPTSGKLIGTTGSSTASLWEWTLTYRTSQPPSKPKQECLPDSQHECTQDSTAEDARSRLQQRLRQSQPLARPPRWNQV